MKDEIAQRALKPNPALAPFEILVGEWETTNSHPLMPGVTLPGRASFEWIAGGAFLMMRQQVDDPRFPQGVAIYGSDDKAGTYFLIYFDERGVSRKYDATMDGRELAWRRDEPSFSQRFEFSISLDGQRIAGRGRMSRDGGDWEDDLQTDYVRVA